MMPDWKALRAEFPALTNWTYLNTATYGQMPRSAADAMNRHLARRTAGLLDDLDRSVQDDVKGKPAIPFLEEHVAGRNRPHAAPGT